MTATQRPLSVRSAVDSLKVAVAALDEASRVCSPGRARLVQYWIAHLESDVKTLELLALAEE